MAADASGWDSTKDASGWPKGADMPIPPMESPMERLVKGFSAIFHQGQPFIRSRQDVWREKHDTQSYMDRFLQNQEAGQVAQQEMQQGLPQAATAERVARAKAQQTVESQRGAWLAGHNPLLEQSSIEGRKFESEHPWLSPEEMQRQEKALGYTPVGGPDDTQGRIDFITKNVPIDQQPAVKTAMAEKAMGLPAGYLSRGAGRTTENFDMLHDKIQKSGLQNQYEVGSDAYGYKIQPRRSFAAKDIAAYKIRADQIRYTSDQIARERRVLETDMRRRPTDAQVEMIKTRLGILDKEESDNKRDWQDLQDNRPDDPEQDPDVQSAVRDARQAGTTARPLVQPKTTQAEDLGELTDDEVAIAKDEAEQGKSRDEIADIIARRRRAKNANP